MFVMEKEREREREEKRHAVNQKLFAWAVIRALGTTLVTRKVLFIPKSSSYFT